jgi:hypothetical protein
VAEDWFPAHRRLRVESGATALFLIVVAVAFVSYGHPVWACLAGLVGLSAGRPLVQWGRYGLFVGERGFRVVVPGKEDAAIAWHEIEEVFPVGELTESLSAWLYGAPWKVRGSGVYATVYPDALGDEARERLERELASRFPDQFHRFE